MNSNFTMDGKNFQLLTQVFNQHVSKFRTLNFFDRQN